MLFTKKAIHVLAFTSIFVLTASLAGCMSIPAFTKTDFTDEELLDKAEFAIGVERSELSLVPGSVMNDKHSVQYQIKDVTGATYRCYFNYTSDMGITGKSTNTSDAVCSKIGHAGDTTTKGNKARASKKSTGPCNDLLRAAGRC
ncbi:MAG: hypothetical protein LUC43_06435 [Burkholderiales bacterium]|nr:hypothetical protein [Burkholderiales bacterium]